LTAYLFFLCNVALLCSVIFRNTVIAGAVILTLVLLFLFGPFIAAGMLDDIATWYHINLQHGAWHLFSEVIDLGRRANPFVAVGATLQTGFTGPVIGFQVLSNLALGVFSFLLSWLVFDWCTRTEKDTGPTRRWIFSRKGRNTRMPSFLAGASAITWKDFRFISGGSTGLLLKFLVMGLLVALNNMIQYESDSKMGWESEGGTLIWWSLFLTVVWLAIEASRVFKDEVRWKTLSALTTLPISVPEIAYRKVIGALAGTLPLLAGVFVGLLMAPGKLGEYMGEISREPSELGFHVVMFLQLIFFLHLTALLSLFIKWGALAAAIGIHFIGAFMFGMFSMILFSGFSGGVGGVLFLAGFVTVVLTIPLHFAIGYRLHHLAAQE